MPGRSRPVANRRCREENCSDPDNPAAFRPALRCARVSASGGNDNRRHTSAADGIAGCEQKRNRGGKPIQTRTYPYGLGAPGIVFGRVAKWTINPTSGTNQPSTTTRVLFGDWRRAESFMIQIAIQSQMAIEISIGINIIPQAPATIPAACFSLSSIGVAVASSCASKVAAVKNNGRPEMSRFMGTCLQIFASACQRNNSRESCFGLDSGKAPGRISPRPANPVSFRFWRAPGV